jgi:hypothetical protein
MESPTPPAPRKGVQPQRGAQLITPRRCGAVGRWQACTNQRVRTPRPHCACVPLSEPAALRWRGWRSSGQTRVRRDPVGAARSFHRALYGHPQRRPNPRRSFYPMATCDLHYAIPRSGMRFGTTSAERSIQHPPWPDNRSLVRPQCWSERPSIARGPTFCCRRCRRLI